MHNAHLLDREVTIAEVLKQAGYSTGHFGKWHLGMTSGTRRKPSPTEHGFYDAVVVSRYTKGKSASATLEMRSWVAATENMLVIELKATGGDIDGQVDLWVKDGNGSEVQCATNNGVQWVARRFREDVVIPTEAACAVRTLGSDSPGFTIKEGETVTILAAMQSLFTRSTKCCV